MVKQEQDHCKHLKIYSDAYKKMSEEGNRAVDQLTKQGKEFEEKNAKIKELEDSVDYLEQLLQDQDNTVHLFDEVSGHYTLETQDCVMNLTSAGVSSGAVGKVIKEVSKLVRNQLTVFLHDKL